MRDATRCGESKSWKRNWATSQGAINCLEETLTTANCKATKATHGKTTWVGQLWKNLCSWRVCFSFLSQDCLISPPHPLIVTSSIERWMVSGWNLIGHLFQRHPITRSPTLDQTYDAVSDLKPIGPSETNVLIGNLRIDHALVVT